MEAKFELFEINIEEEYFPANAKVAPVPDMNKHTWKLGYSFAFDTYKPGYEQITVRMSFDLVPGNDDEAEPIAYVEIKSKFKITAGLKKQYKATILETFFHITVSNIQGIFAAKLQGTPMANILPPSPGPQHYSEEILSVIDND